MFFRTLLVVIAGFGSTLEAHDFITTKLTWTREISRLVYKSCTSCHQEGGSSFSLMTYQDARPWAKAIKEEVLERRMPPWNAVKGFGEFRDDQGLTQEEISRFADWVEGGAPEGDPQYLPHPPHAAQPSNPGRDSIPSRDQKAAVIRGNFTLPKSMTLYAIQPQRLPPSASVQVIAQRPDGSIEPLIWLNQCGQGCDRKYYFASPLTFPKGTRIIFTPQEGVWRISFQPDLIAMKSPARRRRPY